MKKWLLTWALVSSLPAQEVISDVVDDGIPDSHYSGAWIRAKLDPPQSWILARDRSTVLAPAQLSNSIYTTLAQVPKTLYQAVISAEDGGFWQHKGLSYTGIARAAARNLMSGQVSEGGSTLTQQLAKNLYGRTQRDLANKMVEASRTMKLEKYLNKHQILEFYLNVFAIPGNKRGVGAAARYWFNRPVAALNVKEQVFIAATLKGPAIFDPFTQDNDGERARARQRREERIQWILGRMVEEGYLSSGQIPGIMSLPLRFEQGNLESGEFVDRIREVMDSPWWQNQLRARGINDWRSAGIRVVSTIDAGWQNQMQDQLQGHLNKLRKIYPTLEGAGVLMRWGQVWSSVSGFQDQGYDRAFTAKRSLGSVWKMPLYALAFKYGWEPSDTLVNDFPVFPYAGSVFQPKNSHKGSAPLMNVLWTASKSENIATMDLLYRLFEKTKGLDLWAGAISEAELAPMGAETPESWFARIGKNLGVKFDNQSWQQARFEKARLTLSDSLKMEGRDLEALRLRVIPYKLGAKSVTAALYRSGEKLLKFGRLQDSLELASLPAQSEEEVSGDSVLTDSADVGSTLVNADSLWFKPDLSKRLYRIWAADTLDKPWSAFAQSFYSNELKLKIALRLYQGLTADLGLRTSGDPSPSWVLGSKEENLVRMTSAYASLYRGRVYKFADGSPWRLILRVEDGGGRVLINPDGQETGLYGADVAMRVRLLLQSVLRTGTGSGSAFNACKSGTFAPMGGKTGTANESRTVAFMGLVEPGNDYWFDQDVWSLGFMSGRDDNVALGSGEKSLSGAQGAMPPFVAMAKMLRAPQCQSIQPANFQGEWVQLDASTGFAKPKGKFRYWLPLPRPRP